MVLNILGLQPLSDEDDDDHHGTRQRQGGAEGGGSSGGAGAGAEVKHGVKIIDCFCSYIASISLSICMRGGESREGSRNPCCGGHEGDHSMGC